MPIWNKEAVYFNDGKQQELIVHNFWNRLFSFRNQLLSTDFSKLSVVTRNTRTLLAQAEEYELQEREVSQFLPLSTSLSG